MGYKTRSSEMFFFDRTIITLMMIFIFLVSVVVVFVFMKRANILSLDGVIQIEPIACENTYLQQKTVDGKPTWAEIKKEKTELCLPLNRVIGLNNSIKLADSISLLGIFVTVIGLLLPVLGFFSLKHQKESMEASINENIEDRLKIYSGELERIRFNAKEINEIINSKKNQTKNLHLTFLQASKFRQSYISEKLREKSEEYDINLQGDIEIRNSINHPIRYINLILAEAFQIEHALISIIYADDPEVQQSFDIIANYIAPEDVQVNKKYIWTLKYVLGQFHLNNAFNNDNKRKSLNDFLEVKLNTDPVQWFREIEVK